MMSVADCRAARRRNILRYHLKRRRDVLEAIAAEKRGEERRRISSKSLAKKRGF